MRSPQPAPVASTTATTRSASHLQHQLIVTGQVLGRYGSAVNPANSRNDDGDPQFADIHDLNFTYQTVNPTHPGDAPGSYSVLAGDTLLGIARQVYGDSAYWYLLAEANGLRASDALQPGQSLRIPGITGTTYDRADSYKPYDSSTVIGDTTPNLPPPDDGCGFAQIFVVIVAIVVAVIAPEIIGPAIQGLGLGEAATTVVTYGLSYAAASVVSQGVAIALGIQKGFDWKQVGLAAVGGMVSAGIPLPSGGVINSAVKAALANAVTQGVGVVTGLQDHFSWASVAAAGIGAGEVVGDALKSVNAFNELGSFGMKVAQGTVRGFTAGLTTAALRGGRVSVVQVAADAFGSALGYGLADAMRGAPEPAAQYSIASGMRSGLGFKADASVWGPGIGNGVGEYQSEDLSSLVNAQPGMPSQMNDGSGNAYNPAANPEVQARAQRFMAMNPTASNDVTDPSQPVVMTHSPQYGFPIPDLNEYPDRVLPTYVVTPDPRVMTEQDVYGQAVDAATTALVGGSSLTAVGQGADGGLIWNTAAISYPVTAPDIEVTSLSRLGDQQPSHGMQTEPSLLQRFGTGILGALESVTIEPIRQVGDLGKAGASVFYNELLRKPNEPYWFPKLTSNTANAYANGTSQTKLVLGSVPLLNVGIAAYDATTALMQGRYGDAVELGGGIAGGLIIGKGVNRYGEYGLVIDDIGATGLRASQAGAIGLKPVTPYKVVGTADKSAPEFDRKLWQVTPEGTEQVLQNNQFGKFYKSTSDGLWWSKDNAGHGGSEWKVFEETAKGLQWYRDANKYGDFIDGKHKGDIGRFIPWNKLNGAGF